MALEEKVASNRKNLERELDWVRQGQGRQTKQKRVCRTTINVERRSESIR
jgi:hypothetical protein